ncbi:MAG: hypothetical protein KDD50_09595 [Bdellovibrionales bacterium]|nr:hypothetical protein [Bdellovibrionales bacterium]
MNLSANPINSYEDDLIGMRQKALFIQRLIDGCNENSLRIGLFGEWGSGKSSLLRIIEDDKDNEGKYKFIWFNPWLYASEDDLINGFSMELFLKFEKGIKDAVEQNNDLINKVKRIRNIFDFKTMGKIGEIFNNKDLEKLGALGPIISIFKNLFKNIALNKMRIKELVSTETKKTVVVIEDLDRCDHKILPSFLLYIRELLDIKGVTTIFVTEYEQLSILLSDGNSKYSFLEKIYDIPVYLNHSNKDLAVNFITKYEFNPFSATLLEKNKKLLPVNPRFLKKFCKQLSLINDEYRRYGEAELRDEALLLIQLFKFRYPTLFETFVQNPNFVEELSKSRSKDLYSNYSRDEARELVVKAAHDKVFTEIKVDESNLKDIEQFLDHIWNKSNALPTQDFSTYGQFLEAPVKFTIKELNDSFSANFLSLKREDIIKFKEEKKLSEYELLDIVLYVRKVNLEKYFKSVNVESGMNLLKHVLHADTLVLDLFSIEHKFNLSEKAFGLVLYQFRSWFPVVEAGADSKNEEFKKISIKLSDIEFKILDLFFTGSGEIDKVLMSAKSSIDHHRMFRHENAFTKYLCNKLNTGDYDLKDSFVDEVLESKLEKFNSEEYMSSYSSILDEDMFVHFIDKFKKFNGEDKNDLLFVFFENWLNGKSLILNYFTNFSIFIKKYKKQIFELWNMVEHEKLNPWAQKKLVEIKKSLDQLYPEQDEKSLI